MLPKKWNARDLISRCAVHVLDASRSVTVASSLLNENKEQQQAYVENIKAEFEEVRVRRGNRKSAKNT
jgi:5-methyltetrahydrofolate--homocysteine methyltransferase